ncbi:TetR/AcrR family transcriptional regulator [Mycobacterium sp. Aquia_216]|uniref:TetR/AcrR family transcriptional regulator n=1 Tax=Mycobacterium sp. Aquia_216 TaxID=2991729 RepID=UPI00227BCBEF|nr:TetR/AcrR family transcriptional regulator [Mycobacterium sp. Aquia_216]WAJ43043.1 TetR/AcrR family transcriptional regulator [Mycobacterium sp. Aquia_216]
MSATAERLMDLAESHLSDAGYNGYSFRDLAVEAGIKSSSVHHHFPTKAALTVAVMHRYTDNVLAAVSEATEAGADAVAAYISVFRAVLFTKGRMCMGGALGAETGGLPPEVAQAARDFFRRVTGDLSERLGGPDSQAQAVQIFATLEGAMILARALGDTDAFDKATAALA